MKQQPVYLGDYKSLTRTNYGARIYVDTRSIDIASHILLDGDWEPNVTRFIATRLAAGIHFVDVGANFGWYTLLAAMRKCRVTAYEPNPLLVDLLRDSVFVNGFKDDVVIHEAAVMDGEEPLVRFGATVKYPGGGHVKNTMDDLISVKAVSLDDTIPEDQPVHFLKIDAEGSEAAVLRGATRVLENPGIHVLFEHRKGLAEPFDILKEKGFSFAYINSDGLSVPIGYAAALELPSVTMILATR